MAYVVMCLATTRKFNFSKYIYNIMVRNVDSPRKILMYPRFLQVIINNQVDDLTSHNTKYTSLALTQNVFANIRRVGKGFSGVETPLFDTMLVQPPPQALEKEEEEQPTKTSKSYIPLLNSLLETCATFSQKVVELQQDKHTQALEIIKLKKRVKKLEKKKKTKSSGLRRLRKIGTSHRVESSANTVVDDDNGATKDGNAAMPTVFDDEEVTMTMTQTLIKMKAEKARLLDEQIAKWLHDEEVKQVAAREKQERDDLEREKVLQQHLKRKPISIAQARKNMIIYLKNMVGYKMEHFKGITYDKKRVAEETLLQDSFKKLKAVEVLGFESTQDTPTNDPKEMSEEDVQNMLEIVSVSDVKVEALQVKVGGIIEAYQSFKEMLKAFDREDLVALWRLVKENFSSANPKEDKHKALWVELTRLFKPNTDDVFWKLQRYMHDPLTWMLCINCGVHHVSLTRRRDIFMLTEKDYPLSNAVMIMMLSAKIQVEEDSIMARNLVIFIEANKPKSRSLDTSSK
nr:hypothetical protein [Tanacetum cinerariifolium]